VDVLMLRKRSDLNVFSTIDLKSDDKFDGQLSQQLLWV